MLVIENVKSNYAEPYIILKGFRRNAFSNASMTLFTIGTKSLVNSHTLYLFYSPSMTVKDVNRNCFKKINMGKPVQKYFVSQTAFRFGTAVQCGGQT